MPWNIPNSACWWTVIYSFAKSCPLEQYNDWKLFISVGLTELKWGILVKFRHPTIQNLSRFFKVSLIAQWKHWLDISLLIWIAVRISLHLIIIGCTKVACLWLVWYGSAPCGIYFSGVIVPIYSTHTKPNSSITPLRNCVVQRSITYRFIRELYLSMNKKSWVKIWGRVSRQNLTSAKSLKPNNHWRD